MGGLVGFKGNGPHTAMAAAPDYVSAAQEHAEQVSGRDYLRVASRAARRDEPPRRNDDAYGRRDDTGIDFLHPLNPISPFSPMNPVGVFGNMYDSGSSSSCSADYGSSSSYDSGSSPSYDSGSSSCSGGE